ncbi:MAG TPA: hypothetical protein VFO62_08460 [Candidatus Binatia bacterium]|nr:hypothetical protein [Candidatus Binatia bacterium]
MQHRVTRSISVGLFACVLASVSPCHADLLGRLPATPGGTDYQAYYDTVLDVTWLANASLARTETFGVEPINGPETGNLHGLMQFLSASQYIAAMNDVCYLGFSTWRLPEVAPLNGSTFVEILANDGSADRGYNISAPGTPFAGSTASELAYMYYNTLGNLAGVTTSGTPRSCQLEPTDFCLANKGPFVGLIALTYWIGTPYVPNPSGAWAFDQVAGLQNVFGKNLGAHVWPVLDGDLAVNPVVCGDQNGDGGVTAVDALAALVTSVGLGACPLNRCDVDNGGSVTATDALTILRAAVGEPLTLSCPTC